MVASLVAALALAVPSSGVAVQTRAGVDLVALNGRVAMHLTGWHMTGDFPVPVGTVYLRDPARHVWRLGGGEFVGVGRADRSPMVHGCFSTAEHTRICGAPYGQGPSRVFYRGRLVGGSARRHGRWLSVDVSSSGRLLAQWSGECEFPNAYIGPASGLVPAYSTGVETLALGWAGPWAVVAFPVPACGVRGRPPGVYVGRRLIRPLHRGDWPVLWR